MASGPKPVSSRELAERAVGDALAVLERCPTRTATGPAGCGPGRGAMQQDLAARRRGVAEDPAVDEIRPERAHRGEPGRGSRAAAPGASGRGRRRRAATRRSEAGRPAGGRAGRIGLVAGDRRREPLDEPLALGDLANERLAVARRRGPGIPGTTVGRVLRPASRRRERRGQAQPDPRLAVVPDALGDVPVPFPAGQRERLVRQRFDDRGQRGGQRAELRGRWPRPCRDRRDDGPRDGPRSAGPSRCRATPRRCRVRRVRAHRPRRAHRCRSP